VAKVEHHPGELFPRVGFIEARSGCGFHDAQPKATKIRGKRRVRV
jgi:hypothetical protein